MILHKYCCNKAKLGFPFINKGTSVLISFKRLRQDPQLIQAGLIVISSAKITYEKIALKQKTCEVLKTSQVPGCVYCLVVTPRWNRVVLQSRRRHIMVHIAAMHIHAHIF